MACVLALPIFAALTAANWFASLAFYRSTFGPGPDRPLDDAPDGGAIATADPNRGAIAAAAIAAAAIAIVTLTCYLPFVIGYPAGCLVWAFAAFTYLALPTGRAAVLFGYLAVNSLLSRAVVLGVMQMFGN